MAEATPTHLFSWYGPEPMLLRQNALWNLWLSSYLLGVTSRRNGLTEHGFENHLTTLYNSQYIYIYIHIYIILIHSFVLSFIHSFHSFLPSFLPSFLHSFIHSFIPSFLPSFTHSFIHSFIMLENLIYVLSYGLYDIIMRMYALSNVHVCTPWWYLLMVGAFILPPHCYLTFDTLWLNPHSCRVYPPVLDGSISAYLGGSIAMGYPWRFIVENSHRSKWMKTRGTPHFRNPPNVLNVLGGTWRYPPWLRKPPFLLQPRGCDIRSADRTPSTNLFARSRCRTKRRCSNQHGGWTLLNRQIISKNVC